MTVMKKIIVIALLVAFILLIAAIAIGIGSKKVDCSGISDQKTKNRCHLYNLLNSYGLAKDYETFMKSKPYEKPQPKYFTKKFRDEAIDKDNDGKFDALRIYAEVNVNEAGDYVIETWLHDDNSKPFYKFEESMPLKKGMNEAVIEISSQMIYEKKLLGSLKVPYIRLFKDGKQLESITVDYFTAPYSYDDFSAMLPDLVIKSAEKKGNDVIVTIENAGKKPAFAVFVDFLVDGKLHFDKTNQNSVVLLKPGDQKQFTMTAPNAIEYSVIVDPWNKVDELDEGNNIVQIQ